MKMSNLLILTINLEIVSIKHITTAFEEVHRTYRGPHKPFAWGSQRPHTKFVAFSASCKKRRKKVMTVLISAVMFESTYLVCLKCDSDWC